MKIVVQNFKTGKVSLADAPKPVVSDNGILVKTQASLISAGTDRAVVGLAKKGYVGMALARPDLVRRVLRKVKNDGLWSAYKAVQNVIAEPKMLGYSLVGEVLAIGHRVEGAAVGDRVACAGAGHANHAEIAAIPGNLFVAVPQGVADEDAAYVTLGAIAMHGLRQADQQLGATVLVVGLGLVGQITLQLCRAAGLKVIGLDLDEAKLELALKQGAMIAAKPDDPDLAAEVSAATDGYGVDAVLLTAGSKDSGAPFEDVASHCRDRARVVVVGDVKMDIPRNAYFKKELEILQSRSYGPGRYDPDYEEKGRDYPIGYVRWTERRNMKAFMDLLASGALDMQALTTHRFPVERAGEAYDLVSGKTNEFTVGIVLTYGPDDADEPKPAPKARRKVEGKVGLGIIGAGNFAKGVLVPAMTDTGGFDVRGVVSARGLSAEAMKERTGAQYSDSEPSRVLDDADVDAVVIATRHDSHARYVVQALEKGKHVFVEKPLCLSRDELQQIETAAEASQGILMVGFNRRHSPLIAAVRAHFDGRTEPLAMTYRVNAGRIPNDHDAAWVHDPEVGGGRIIGEACHAVDTLQAVSGARPVDLHAAGLNPRRSGLSADDVVTITIGFDDGSLGTVHYFSNGDAGFPKERLEVFGQERVAVIDDWRSLELVAGGKSQRQKSQTMQKGYAEEAQAFLAACRTGEAPVAVSSLIETTLVTLLAVEDLHGAWDETPSDVFPEDGG
jgi:predicted dehydrogenase/threonine dehydrogenase-like Zn-dependent dehydrogenase